MPQQHRSTPERIPCSRAHSVCLQIKDKCIMQRMTYALLLVSAYHTMHRIHDAQHHLLSAPSKSAPLRRIGRPEINNAASFNSDILAGVAVREVSCGRSWTQTR